MFRALVLVFCLLPVTASARARQPEAILHSFDGGIEGAFPGALTVAPDGTIYGMTGSFSGSFGAVFAVTPPAGGTTGTTRVIYAFQGGVDGSGADGRLLRDSAGNLYGLTALGGTADGDGTAFVLAPRKNPGLPWTKTVIANFGRGEGAGNSPVGGLAFGPSGALYGVTSYGGDGSCGDGCGTVFRLSPPADGGTLWRKSVLYEFQGLRDGASPSGPVLVGLDGVITGTASAGGDTACEGGCGTVWRLTPPSRDGEAWRITSLHVFTGFDGAAPSGVPVADESGDLYVNLPFLGSYGHGAVVRLSPPHLPGGAWRAVTLHAFRGGLDGDTPFNSLTADLNGNLYGVTAFGGREEQGTVFKLAPPQAADPHWRLRVLHEFHVLKDGHEPLAPVVFGGGGLIYGSTYQGGAANLGTVFELRP